MVEYPHMVQWVVRSIPQGVLLGLLYSMTGITKAMVYATLSVEWCI